MTRIRRGLLAAILAVSTCAATASAADLRVALVADPGGAREEGGAAEYMGRMQAALERAALPYAVVTEDDVIGGALDGFSVGIVPYAPNLGAAGKAALRAFCSDGGKVMCFYSTYGLERELGLRGVTYVASPDRTMFCRVRCEPASVPGLPDGFAQVSWNISAPTPAEGTLVLARWLDAAGNESGRVAATLSETGFFFSHVLVPEGDAEVMKAGLLVRAAAQYLAARRGARRDVAIVHGTVSEASGSSDGALVPTMVSEMGRILDAAGVPYSVLPDEMVARGALAGRKVAILPLNFRLADGEAEAIRAFTAAGGKVIGCFSVNDQVWPLLGVAEAQFKAGGARSPFHVVRFNEAAPAGFPESFAQRSSNIMAARPAADGTVVADWCDVDGTDTGFPAVILSETGMYFSYVLRAGDVSNTSQFILAAIAHMAGKQYYVGAAESALERLWDLRRYGSRTELTAACLDKPRAADAATEAARLEAEARGHLLQGRPDEAYLALRRAREAAELACVRSLPARGGREFRGGWLHDVSVPGQDWDKFFEGMRRARLNALLPNVCAAGYAHYQSDLLPLSPFVRANGPQVQPMLDAARRHGIEVHLWRVNYNLGRPDEAVLQRYIAANRVCLNPEGGVVGGPRNATLCPSHPDNQRLEIEAMLEMTRKFHPDGIHFDYIRYCSGCRARFEQRLGATVAQWPQDVLPGGPLREEYLDFRRDQITHVVREVSRRSRQIDPNVKISAAVFSDWERGARDGVGQDWPTWVAEGYLDFVCPMNYTQDTHELGRVVAEQRTRIGPAALLMSGIGAWRSPSAWHTADLVDTARASGADGLVFFEYRGRVAGELVPALAEGPLREPAGTPWSE